MINNAAAILSLSFFAICNEYISLKVPLTVGKNIVRV